ncbi:MAG: hypothetical protein ABSA66_08345 [Roseiarcus sp.]|jgi:hypothetical protein
MFTETAKLIFANLGLATVARNKLVKASPDVAYDLVKVPHGVQIVRSTPVEPVAVVPETHPKCGDLFKLVVNVRRETEKWITMVEPLPHGTIWLAKCHVISMDNAPDGTTEIYVPLRVAKKKGWAA